MCGGKEEGPSFLKKNKSKDRNLLLTERRERWDAPELLGRQTDGQALEGRSAQTHSPPHICFLVAFYGVIFWRYKTSRNFCHSIVRSFYFAHAKSIASASANSPAARTPAEPSSSNSPQERISVEKRWSVPARLVGQLLLAAIRRTTQYDVLQIL